MNILQFNVRLAEGGA
ncbi:hypothetical protein SEEE151_18747, partial [Salmonella enterica subsp. enterica serovar Enteritidis str. SE15-1]